MSAAPPAPGPDPVGEAAARLRDELGLSFDGPLRIAFEAGLADAALERGESIEATIAAVCAGDPGACDLLVELAVVHETCFYRHPDQLELVAQLAAPAPGGLRLWSAGCATGEEAYSVAMALAEAGRPPGGALVLGPVELPLARGTPLLPTAEAAGLRWVEDAGVGYLRKDG